MNYESSKFFKDFNLWPHQQKALIAIEKYLKAFANGSTIKSALIQMPTGSGKSGVIAIAAHFNYYDGAVLVLTPRISLKNQLYRDINHRFFEHIEYDIKDLPKTIRRINDGELPPIDGEFSDIVFVTTIQKLVSLRKRHPFVFKKFINNISLVIVDEGHYEPAKEWSKVIREIFVPKIVFTATPYRNDFKIFDIDLNYTYVLSFKEAASKYFLRDVQIVDREPFHTPRDFVVDVLEFYNSQFQTLGEDPPRVIIRCDDRAEIRQIARELINQNQSVVAIHECFRDKTGETWERRTVPDPDSETAIFWIHQFKLLEGIDDYRFQVLALYKRIENGRALVQQVGRIIRNPSQQKESIGYMLDHWNGHHTNLWEGYLRYDCALFSHGSEAVRLPTNEDLIQDLIKCQAPTGYIKGRFRAPFRFEDINPYEDLQLPLRTNLLVKMEIFSIAKFAKTLVDTYINNDRVAEVYNLKPNSCLVLSVDCSNSSYLLNHVFIEADLHLAVIHEFDDYVGFYETSGLSMINRNDIGLGGSIDTKRLRCLFRLNQQSKLTSITLKNTNLGTSVIRTRSITASSIESVVPSLDDYAQICTTAEGYSNDKTATYEKSFEVYNEKVRRYVGFSRGRVSQASGNYALLSEYLAWLELLDQILNSNNKPLSVFSRYAKEIKTPKYTKPKNLLLDISDIRDFYINNKDKLIEIVDTCIEVESNGSIEFYANGEKVFGRFAFNCERNRYELDSDVLEERYYPISSEYPSNINKYINQHQAFRVIPQSRGTVYVNGHFYQPTIKVGSEFDSSNYALGNCFITDHIIGATNSEKGEKIINNGEEWEPNSLFGIIDSLGQGTTIESILGKPDILVCDDMGKEAADFFVCKTSKESPVVILIHAKASKDVKECSASCLHDICSQAVKNLGYLAMFNRERPTHVKTRMWEKGWNNPKIGYINKRIRHGTGTSAELWQKIQDTINNPMAQKEVWLLLGQILSRKTFEEKLGKSTPPAEALQAAYLLQATMVEVAAIGAKLRIICGP